MKIPKDSITNLARGGHLTLQVPHIELWVDEAPPDNREEVPDEWFCWLKGNRPVVGKETGFLFLTRAGYEANKKKLKKAFEAAIAEGKDRTDGEGWPAFERHAEEHFARIEKAIKKEIQAAEKKSKTLKNFKV